MNERSLQRAVRVAVLALWCSGLQFLSLARAEEKEPTKFRAYIGTYANEPGRGIFMATFDATTGTLGQPELAAETRNPSFLAIHPRHTHLYAVSEIDESDGKKAGAVAAFRIDAASGKLTLINKQASQGRGPCHVVVDAFGKVVLVANYGSGSIASLPVADDGSLQPAACAIQHVGKGVNPQRQEGPHAHSINLNKSNRFAFVADLGLDKVLVYRLDPLSLKLVPHDPPSVAVAAGAGPRHFAFHPVGHRAYVNNEMASTVTVFAYNSEKGALTELQTLTTLPADFKGNNSTAEVVAHPTGKFLYVSNRGHDSIAMFTIDGETGKLTALGHESTGGKTPRNFVVDPTGRWLLAENQASDTITVFAIDASTGKLRATGQKVSVPAPVCIRFVPLE